MKSFLAFVLISALGVLTIGCDSQKGTTENKCALQQEERNQT